MKKIGLIIGVSLLASIPAMAQVDTAWVRTFGNTLAYGKNIAVDTAGNVYVNGYQQHTFGSVMIAYNSAGNALWSRSFDGFDADDSHGLDMSLNCLGDIYVVGPTLVNHVSCFNLIRCSIQGDSIWARTYNGPVNHSATPWALVSDSVGNVYITGNSDGPSWATLKYNRDGNLLWTSIYTGHPDLTPMDVQKIALDGEGNVIVLGVTRDRFGEWIPNLTTIKYDNDGSQLWAATYDSISYSFYDAVHMAVDHSGNILINATSMKQGDLYSRPVIVKYLPNGDTAWVRAYGEADNPEGLNYFIALDSVGYVYLAGPTYIIDSLNYDLLIVKYTPDGDVSWAGTYDSGYDDLPQDIAVGQGGAIYVGGISDRGQNDYHIINVKYASNGDQVWATGYYGAGELGDWMRTMTLDSRENIYVAGQSDGHLLTIKFVQTETGVEDNKSPYLPEDALLLAAYPNPFNARTTISYSVAQAGPVSLEIYNLLGGKVTILQDGIKQAGPHQIIWNAKDIPSGVYFARLNTGVKTQTIKMVVLK